MTRLVFWISLLTAFYVYAGFAVLVVVMGAVRRRSVRKLQIEPKVTLLIAAYNEAGVIAAKLDNALALDYPQANLQIIVASDGSDDSTASIVERYRAQGVKLLSLPRRGKLYALNHAVTQATGDILLFSDANTMLEAKALRHLVANFADGDVGGVVGNTKYLLSPDGQSSGDGENLYWRYDTWLKEMEGRTGSVVSAHGGMYAIRRELYQPISDRAVTDDFAISTAVIAHGYRLVFEKKAAAWEAAVGEAQQEFGRKVRLMTRGLRAVILRRALLNPLRYGFYSLVLFTHKILRRLVPVGLVALLISSIALSTAGTIYQVAAVVQLCFYLLAFGGFTLRRRPALGKSKIFYVPFFYCLANAAALTAVIKLAAGQRIELWQPQRHGGAETQP